MLGGGGFDLNAWQAADVVATEPDGPTSNNFQQQLVDNQTAVIRGTAPRVGDWSCEDCRNINFAKRTRCNKCGARRRVAIPADSSSPASSNVEDGRQALTSRCPLFKAGDWHCTHCGNVNWARRNKCNVCNGPKPNQEDEPRMGRGGGHFDLQNPEDRLSHNSEDEEYDEYGRKKKKRKKTPGALSGRTCRSQGANAPIDTSTQTASTTPLYFPPPPPCYIRGRSRLMDSESSTSSDYEEIEDD